MWSKALKRSNKINIVLKEASHRQKFNGTNLFSRVNKIFENLLDRTSYVNKERARKTGPISPIKTALVNRETLTLRAPLNFCL